MQQERIAALVQLGLEPEAFLLGEAGLPLRLPDLAERPEPAREEGGHAEDGHEEDL
jgi:hypothetical protein